MDTAKTVWQTRPNVEYQSVDFCTQIHLFVVVQTGVHTLNWFSVEVKTTVNQTLFLQFKPSTKVTVVISCLNSSARKVSLHR